MKIAWFTPLAEGSAIGRASSYIVRELAKVAEVEVWHFERAALRAVEVKTVFAPAAELGRLTEFDLVVYNLGNHLPYHGEIFEVSRQYPGVVILHDYVMHHFFAALYLEKQANPAGYVAEMEHWYGQPGRTAAERSLAGERVWESDDVVDFPLVERCTESALGVIAHSEYLLEAVRRAYTGPTRRIALPYETATQVTEGGRDELGIPDGALLLVTVGHVNPNKRVHAVLEAIGPETYYVVAGPADPVYQRRLDGIVKERGLGERVRFLGRVSDATLHCCLAAADICFNLRLPAIEGASASVIEEMLYGKAVVVTDVGFYRELPAECVVKINPEHEVAELAAALERLADPGERKAIGERALAYARETFRADRYARDLLRFGWDVRNAQPLLGLSDRIVGELQRMKVSTEMAIVDTVAETVGELFCT
ncbi:MAG: glycosyltransferase family 4 protein [Acidobacteriota bacterium]